MGDSLPRMPLHHRAEFDAGSFILAKDIRDRTNKAKQTKLQTVIDISTPCLSACVYNNAILVKSVKCATEIQQEPKNCKPAVRCR